MIERVPEPVTTPWNDHDDPNQDTIALLQEEIARLEAELRARDRDWPPPTPESAAAEPEGGPDGGGAVRITRLLSELADRDETVEALLEQSRLFDQAAAAQRSEWEQLHQWVDEVERRVEGRDTEDRRLRAELESERVRSDSVRRSAESDRRAWDAHRAGLEREAQVLRDRVARQADGPDARGKAEFLELAAENRQLHTAREASQASAAEAEELGRRLAAALAELEQAGCELRRLDDDRRRERSEHEAEAAALRSRIAHESLGRHVGPEPDAAAEAPARSSATEADERIRAFRLHLKDLHEAEAAGHAGRSIASRLSRLWGRTGPG